MLYYCKAYYVLWCTILFTCSSAFLLQPSSNNRRQTSLSAERSIWASSEWKFTFNLGREPGTLMDETWGASNERLIFDLPVEAKADTVRGGDDPMLQRNGCTLSPLSVATYKTGDEETKQCSFANGEWKIQLPRGANGKAAKLMCYVDVQTPLRKNDISLDKGERIYFTAKCWRTSELDRALRRLKPVQQEFRAREYKLAEAPANQYGIERLVIDRDNALQEYQDANIYFPTINDDDDDFNWTAEDLEWEEGPWPGEEEDLTIEPLFMMVRRTKLFVKEEYHVIGTWAAEPMEEEEE